MKYIENQLEKQVEVVLVSAGPVGSLSVIELTSGSVKFLALERRAHSWRKTDPRSS
jgi:hypothetical protein